MHNAKLVTRLRWLSEGRRVSRSVLCEVVADGLATADGSLTEKGRALVDGEDRWAKFQIERRKNKSTG